ncbi:MAG: hypothetical protein ACR2LR_19960 [Hassallia sp.]
MPTFNNLLFVSNYSLLCKTSKQFMVILQECHTAKVIAIKDLPEKIPQQEY